MKILKIKQNERIFADLFQYLWNNNMNLHGRLAQYTYEKSDENNKSLNEFIEWLVLEESKGTMINFEERVRNKAKEIFGR